ncbi:MAG: hypothetical protein U0930_16070 [Pirellulales bacterium]
MSPMFGLSAAKEHQQTRTGTFCLFIWITALIADNSRRADFIVNTMVRMPMNPQINGTYLDQFLERTSICRV